MKRKSICAFLALVFVLSLAVGCRGGGSSVEKNEEFVPEILQSNGVALQEYSVVISQNASMSVRYAAEELNRYVRAACGYTLEVKSDASQESQYEILLGKTNRAVYGQVDFSALGEEGYHTFIADLRLVIASEGSRGVLYGVYDYLEALGYRFYTPDCETIPVAGDVFVAEKYERMFVPVFAYREVMYKDAWDSAFAVRRGINSDFMRDALKTNEKYGGGVGFAGGGRMLVHTMSELLPRSYFSSNPEYFSLRGDKRTDKQPCLSNENVLRIVSDSVMNILKNDPSAKIVSVSQNDNEEYCECERCTAEYGQYGKSGQVINFVNRIARRVAEKYPNVYLETLSYQYTSELPSGGVKPDDNVIIRLCTDMCHTHTDEKECAVLKTETERLRQWSQISRNVYVWYYVANYVNYFAPFPNFTAMQNAFSLFAKNGVNGVYSEGFGHESPEFGELRSYLLSKLSLNPRMSYSEYRYHMKDFLTGYYGEGGEKILEYIDLLEKTVRENVQGGGDETALGDVTDYLPIPYDREQKKYDMKWIDAANALWDEAETLADDEQQPRLEKSRLSLTYTELYYTMSERYKYGTEAERAELVERNEKLYRDIFKYGTTRKYNEKEISSGVTDFILSPKYW